MQNNFSMGILPCFTKYSHTDTVVGGKNAQEKSPWIKNFNINMNTCIYNI